MKYSQLVSYYDKLESTTKRLEKTYIISDLLKETKKQDINYILHLIQGKVFPLWDERKIGFSVRLALKSISSATGTPAPEVEKEFAKKGDLGLVAENLIKEKKQRTLFSKEVTVEKVFENIRKLATLEGEGTVNRKLQLVTELLTSSKPEEAKFIIRTVLEQLRVGVSAGILRDAIAWTYLPRIKDINDKDFKAKSILYPESLEQVKNTDLKKYDLIDSKEEKLNREIYNYLIDLVQNAFDITNDFATVAEAIQKYGLKAAEQEIKPGTPINSMLSIKVDNIEEAFKAIHKPAFFDTKVDGFRLQCHKHDSKITLFTRRLENVTKQFPDVVESVKRNIKGKSFIIDGEAAGYDPKTKSLMPFQAVSQRIKRKYNIESTIKKLPVQLFVFDILYYNGKNLMQKQFKDRRNLLEKITREEKYKLVLTEKLITDSEEKAEQFYKKMLKQGHEGLMGKKIDSPYKPGRYVEGWIKLKPILEPLDLTITAADFGEGKRAGWLTSYTLACRKNEKLVEIGKASTGLKEKSEGLSFKDMTELLKPLITEQKGKHVIVEPKIVIEVAYEEIQKSPTYESGFALRFPRITKKREDKGIKDCDDVKRIEKIYKSQKGKK